MASIIFLLKYYTCSIHIIIYILQFKKGHEVISILKTAHDESYSMTHIVTVTISKIGFSIDRILEIS